MKALVVDTETTGLVTSHLLALDRQAEVIEFAAISVNLKSGKISDRFSTLIKPTNYPITERTVKDTKTHLVVGEDNLAIKTARVNEMLANAPPFRELAPKIKELIETAPLVIAHNAAFDTELLNLEFERLGEALKWPRLLCTVEQTISMKGHRLSQTDLHLELFGKAFEEAHRALPDTEALTRIAIELYRRDYL
jgi:DNA polymerase III epsilon subunit-like protein